MTEQPIEIPFTDKQKTIACIISQYMLKYKLYNLCKTQTDAVGTYAAIKNSIEHCLDKLEGSEDEFKQWIKDMTAEYIDYVATIHQTNIKTKKAKKGNGKKGNGKK